MNSPYESNKKVLAVLLSCQTPEQFRVAQKLTLAHTDELQRIISTLGGKMLSRRDDTEYAKQLGHLIDTTLRSLREVSLRFEVA